jgi:hypothetical protein
MIPRKAFTVYPLVNGEFIDGTYTERRGEPYIIAASKQSLTEREMQSLPEGRRNKDSFFLFSGDLLNTLDEQNPDIVVIDNEDFEVFKRATWGNNIINHYKYTVVKRDTEETYNFVDAMLQVEHLIEGEIIPTGD